MTLQPGQMLSHYRLVEKIGEGGMGVVWRAVDTTLGREVAVKVLPDLLTADAERLARFEREAKVLASLSHPSIATVHGFHDAGGVRFLAMELAPGASLAQRLSQGPLPLDDALGIALRVAEALEAAHDGGVIHRDLKPGNIQVSDDGKVKVLDFGLAKALETDLGSSTSSLSPTLTTPATRAGVILGTAAYMSPEQAKGKPVDRRADIWAFGCVLYEMLAGRRPFVGDGVSETLAAVIMAPIDLERVPKSTPPAIRRLLRRCLERDPKKRLRDIGEARLVLAEVLSGASPPEEAAAAPAAAPSRRPAFAAIAAVAVLASLAGAALAWSLLRRPPAAAPARRFEIATKGPFRSGSSGCLLAISPDGRRVAYMDGSTLRIRAFERLETKAFEVAAEPVMLFWSPDSAWLAWGSGGKLWKVSAEGGAVTLLADAVGTFSGGSGASWGPDGRIVLARGDGSIDEVPAQGGDLKTLVASDPNSGDYHEPSWLPDGSGVLYVHHVPGGRPDTLVLHAGGTGRTLLRIEGQDIWHPVYASTGHILYRRQPVNRGIWALPFSLSRHEVTGEPFLVAPEGDTPSVSNDGTLVHSMGTATRQTQMVWVDRSGKLLAKVGQPQEHWPFPSLAPDDRRVAIAAAEAEEHEVWIHDVDRGTKTRLTFGAKAFYAVPAWTADGERLFVDQGSSTFSTRMFTADGRAVGEELAPGWSSSLSADGRYLVYGSNPGTSAADIWYRDLSSNGEPLPLVKAKGEQFWPRISPDGAYVAYVSRETDSDEIYVTRFPSGEGKWQVSVSGGFWPKWSARGDRLYYVLGETILEVDVATKPVFSLGRPREVLEREPLGWPILFGWPPGFDVSKDGQRFLLLRAEGEKHVAGGFVVVESWLTEFAKTR